VEQVGWADRLMQLCRLKCSVTCRWPWKAAAYLEQ
jgi:hypothetical protein